MVNLHLFCFVFIKNRDKRLTFLWFNLNCKKKKEKAKCDKIAFLSKAIFESDVWKFKNIFLLYYDLKDRQLGR